MEDVEQQPEKDPEEKPLIKNEINITVAHSEEKKTISFDDKLEGKHIFEESLNRFNTNCREDRAGVII